MSVNKVILLGNVGQEPSIKKFDGGQMIAKLSLATTERGYTLQNGTQVPEKTEWHNLIFRNGLAEVVEKYIKKGDKLYVEGKLRTRSYDDANSVQRTITEVYVDSLDMITPKKDGNQTKVETKPSEDLPW